MSKLTVGSIVYETSSGLGILAKDFFNHGIFQRALIQHHPNYPNVKTYPDEARYEWETLGRFLDGLDALLCFETAFNWQVVPEAKKRGIKTILMPMYEYTPFPTPYEMDLYLCPSLLDLQYYSQYHSVFIPVPVDVPWRLHTNALTFVHNAGHGGHNFRNGTPELLEAVQYLESDAKVIVRGQPSDRNIRNLFKTHANTKCELVLRELDSAELFATGDVFVFPEKFNGLCLPLQEAYASGMLVMAADRFPMNKWLPIYPLIPVAGYEKDHIAVDFQKAIVDPKTIAKHIDNWYGRDIQEFSYAGRNWAEQRSWDVLGPKYLEAIEKF